MRCLYILSMASTVLSARHSHAKARRIEKRALQDLNLDAAAIFPPHMEKRGLLDGLLNTVVPAVGTVVGGVVTPLVTALAAAPTTTTSGASAPTTSSSNAPGQSPVPTTSNAASPSPNNPTNPGVSPTSSANSPNTTGGPSNGSASAGGSAGGSGTASKDGIVGADGSTGSGTAKAQVVTDRLGNSLTVTGAYTMTYVTTLPNGVVSTVTEVITPTFEASDSSPRVSMEPGKIAAIVGTLVVVFIVSFAVAFGFLIMRKRQKRRQIQLTRSRPTSASSFGSASDEFAYVDERRNSRAALAPSASIASFATAHAYVNGTVMEFPLPPVPAAPPSRPLSGGSDLSFDFSQYGKSRASIIEERNQLRKIGQYPDADSYTPFVLPPSEFGHSTETSSTPRISVIMEKGIFETSQDRDLLMPGGNENPFSDPVSVPQASYAPVTTTNPLSNNMARRSTLWRSVSSSSDVKAASAATHALQTSPSRNTVTSLASSAEYGTAQSHRDTYAESSSVPSRHPSISTAHHSYHSAFEPYTQGDNSTPPPVPADNPFADQPLPPTAQTPSPRHVAYPSLRPNTATSSGRPNTAASSGGTSVVSSVGNGNRDLGATPDPKDLFYGHSGERSLVPRGRISEESIAPSDGGSTVRGSHIAYPELWDMTTRVHPSSKLSQSHQ